MSQDFFDQEIIADFIAEAKEHLETIEPNLLELEKSPDNLSLLNDIFRPMHSLKGASGFLGFNRINQLAHKCENILDELRKGDMQVTSEIMDVILASTDALNQIIANLEQSSEEGDVETQHLMEQIDAIMAGESPAASASVIAENEPEEDMATVMAQLPPDDIFQSPATVETSPADTPSPSPLSPVEASVPCTSGEQLSPAEWIASLPLGEPYKLVTFGEGHLKDFIEEAREIIENLNKGLLELEESSSEQEELVHNIFRFFHNLKGNSGIICYRELNELTHEAETVLNSVRKGEMTPSGELVDLLLLVVDCMEVLVDSISLDDAQVSAPDISALLSQLQQVNAGGAVELPPALRASQAVSHLETTQVEDTEAIPETESLPSSATTIPDMLQAVSDPVGQMTADTAELSSATTEALSTAAPASQPLPVSATASSVIDDEPALDAMTSDTEVLPELPAKAEEQPSTASPATLPPSGEAVADSAPAPLSAPLIMPINAKDDDDETMFRATVNQQMEIIRSALTNLAQDGQHHESIDALYRCLIAIRNACGFFNLNEIKIYADRTAGIVDQGRKAGMDFSLMLDLMRQETAIIDDMLKVANLSEPTPPPAATKPVKSTKPAAPVSPAPQQSKSVAQKTPTPKSTVQAASATTSKAARSSSQPEVVKSSSTIRVDHEKLDHLMNLIGELIINRNRYSLIARHLEEGGSNVNVAHIAQSLSETTYAMARISDELQDTIMKVRMVPVSTVFTRFPRLVRDLSRKIDKEVELVMEGEETELDKSVVEVIGDPMVHLIRNAVDHGIESEEERRAAGKSPKGTITLRAFHKGNSVAIEIEDDGKGIDPVKMREVAVRKGIITPEEAQQLDDQAAIELIFAPGFSSAAQITDISGRGVGMDVVRTNIKSLKGSVSTDSILGKGTRFTLTLPLTLAIIDALMVNVSGETYAIPLDAVSETTKLESARLTDINGRHAITLRGEVLGIVELAELLGLPHSADLPEIISVVVIHANGRRLGLVVDNLVERQEIVIKPLGAYLGDLRGLSGATIMGDGSVILILDPHEIYRMSTGVGSSLN